MLEKRKEESEAIGKYQSMLMSCVIAAVIVFLAPTLVLVVTGADTLDEGDLFAPPSITYETTDDAGNKINKTKVMVPDDVAAGLQGLYELLLWFVRIVLIMMAIVSVIMLRVDAQQQQRPAAAAE